jgi:hypothetical protein
MIDQNKKLALIKYIQQRENAKGTEILIPFELYFDGYDDPHCSVCANNDQPISTAQFVSRLTQVQNRPDVAAVFVRFYEYSDALAFQDSWIGSDTIYVITSATLDAVRGWFSDFEPSDVWAETDAARFPNLPELPDGFSLIAIWWD